MEYFSLLYSKEQKFEKAMCVLYSRFFYYHFYVYMHQPRRCNEQAVLRNQINKHKIFSSFVLFTNNKSVAWSYALVPGHVTIHKHFKKGRNQRSLHKTFGLFLHNQKIFTVARCCFPLMRGKENKYSKCSSFPTGQGRKVSLVEI